jgi:hypothetical protein
VGGAFLPLSAWWHQLNDDIRFVRLDRLSDCFGELSPEFIYFRDDVSYDESGVVVGYLEQFTVVGLVGRDDREIETPQIIEHDLLGHLVGREDREFRDDQGVCVPGSCDV